MAIRWIVIGVGDITTKRVLPAILAEPRSVLAGIVTRNPAKAEPYGVPCWTSLDVALAEQECDAVYVASPVVLHAPQTIASLRAGRHVLCEKPMAMNYEEALSMQRDSRRGRPDSRHRVLPPHVSAGHSCAGTDPPKSDR